MKSLGRFVNGPKYGNSSFVRAPKNNISLPVAPFQTTPALRYSVIARIGAEPVPVQIISRCEFGWFGIRKVPPNGPITLTTSPFFRSHR